MYKETVEELSGGNISINVQSGGQYGGEAEQLELLRNGDIPLIGGSLGLEEATLINSSWVINGTCFIYDENPKQAFEDFWTAFLKKTESPSRLQKKGAKPLVPEGTDYRNSFVLAPVRHTIANKPIRKPADAEGVKFRAAPSPYMLASFNGVGFNAEIMPVNELYQAAQRDVITGSEGDPLQVMGAGLHEVLTHYMLTKHLPQGFWFTAHTGTFNSLPTADQKLLQNAAKRTKEKAEPAIAQVAEDKLEELSNSGVTIVEDIDHAAFREKAIAAQRKVYEKNSDNVPMTLDEVTEITLNR